MPTQLSEFFIADFFCSASGLKLENLIIKVVLMKGKIRLVDENILKSDDLTDLVLGLFNKLYLIYQKVRNDEDNF
jgi:hypothetical protein